MDASQIMHWILTHGHIILLVSVTIDLVQFHVDAAPLGDDITTTCFIIMLGAITIRELLGGTIGARLREMVAVGCTVALSVY